MANVYNSSGEIISSVYDRNGNMLTVCYDSQGNQLSSHAITNRVTRSPLLSPDIPTGTQGFAIDNTTQTIAQLYAGYIYMIDISDGSYTKTNNINLGHGSTGQFAPTKTNEQEYPTLYVCGPVQTVNDNPYLYLLELSCTSTTVQADNVYAVPAITGQTGTCQTCIDFENNIVYLVSASTYYGTADYMYISAWDMTEKEVLDGATYLNKTPYVLTNKLSEFSIPFVPEMQSCTFFDGLVVLLSDRSLAENKYIEFVDVEFQDVYLTLTSQMLSGELEGVGFLANSSTGQHDMIVSQRVSGSNIDGGNYVTEYYRYEFN